MFELAHIRPHPVRRDGEQKKITGSLFLHDVRQCVSLTRLYVGVLVLTAHCYRILRRGDRNYPEQIESAAGSGSVRPYDRIITFPQVYLGQGSVLKIARRRASGNEEKAGQ